MYLIVDIKEWSRNGEKAPVLNFFGRLQDAKKWLDRYLVIGRHNLGACYSPQLRIIKTADLLINKSATVNVADIVD